MATNFDHIKKLLFAVALVGGMAGDASARVPSDARVSNIIYTLSDIRAISTNCGAQAVELSEKLKAALITLFAIYGYTTAKLEEEIDSQYDIHKDRIGNRCGPIEGRLLKTSVEVFQTEIELMQEELAK